ncbi:MAG: D-alanyl-D-alanine carboxypeptidase family protein [Deltaproteobacteria bacterium]|nr:D-alanyl-D-alanine carboxypeptidase family protein [Deltaproteobacteria bacterium]
MRRHPLTDGVASPRLVLLLAALSPSSIGCLALDEGPPSESTSAGLAVTVADHVAGGCSTSAVLGLSRQIADEITCMAPDALASFEEGSGIQFVGSAVLPYLAPGGRDELVAAAAEGPLEVISAFRTLPQQLLLRRWYEQGRCGITAAAQPGRSNHETGRAIDFGNRDAARGRLGRHGWEANVPGDPNHFEHLDSPDRRGLDVTAFQRLWNRNHPEDLIAEDGAYGNQTASRLLRSPAAGFELGAGCGDDPVAQTVWVDNAGAAFTTTGTWGWSTNVSGYFGDGYRVLRTGRTGSATWSLGLQAAGRYEVWAAYPSASDRNPRARFLVETLAGSAPTEVVVDQKSEGPILLGTYHLEPSARVTLQVDRAATGATIADAIRLVPAW